MSVLKDLEVNHWFIYSHSVFPFEVLTLGRTKDDFLNVVRTAPHIAMC